MDGVSEAEADGGQREGVQLIHGIAGGVRVGLVAGVEGVEGEDQPPPHSQHDQ